MTPLTHQSDRLGEIRRGPDAPPAPVLSTTREGSKIVGPGTLAATPAVRPQSEERPHPPTPTGDELDAPSARSCVRSAVPCSLCGREAADRPDALCEFCRLTVELGGHPAVCISTENAFGSDIARSVVTGRCVKAGHEYHGRAVG